MKTQCVKKQTKKLLWYQQLGHPCDKHLQDASEAMNGVPNFTSTTSVLDSCPTCIWAKQTKARKQPDAPETDQKPSKFNSHTTKRAPHPKPNSRKGMFLGNVPCTTRNMLWHNPETTRVKAATHARFDEGFNDIPITKVSPNVVHLQQTNETSHLLLSWNICP